MRAAAHLAQPRSNSVLVSCSSQTANERGHKTCAQRKFLTASHQNISDLLLWFCFCFVLFFFFNLESHARKHWSAIFACNCFFPPPLSLWLSIRCLIAVLRGCGASQRRLHCADGTLSDICLSVFLRVCHPSLSVPFCHLYTLSFCWTLPSYHQCSDDGS